MNFSLAVCNECCMLPANMNWIALLKEKFLTTQACWQYCSLPKAWEYDAKHHPRPKALLSRNGLDPLEGQNGSDKRTNHDQWQISYLWSAMQSWLPFVNDALRTSYNPEWSGWHNGSRNPSACWYFLHQLQGQVHAVQMEFRFPHWLKRKHQILQRRVHHCLRTHYFQSSQILLLEIGPS